MWRLIDLEYADPYLNMAVEEAIMQYVSIGKVPNTLRFWRNCNTIVIGRSQCPSYEVNLKNCLRHRVSVVRRFTGGGAVYHDLGNLSFALSVARSLPILKNDMFNAFRLVGCSVIDGLRKIGLKAELRSVNCIETVGGKISGLAGLWGKVCFVHGSLLVSTRLKILHNVLNPTIKRPVEKRVRSVKSRVTTVSKELNREIAIYIVKDAIRSAIEQAFDVEIVEGKLTEGEEALAKKLCNNKYSKMEWNLEPCRQCPNKVADEQIFKLPPYKITPDS